MSDFDPKRCADSDSLGGVRITPEQARQGREGRPVLYVLIAGLALTLLAWVGVEHYPRSASRTASIPAPLGAQAPARSESPPAPASQDSAPASSDSAR